jgi:phosphatidyl-myo-inositol dimannoside synthase
MSILVITGTTAPQSGLGRYSKEVIDELRRQGEEVTVLAIAGQREVSLEQTTGVMALIRNAFRARRASRGVKIVHAFDAWPFALYGLYAVLGSKKKLFINGVGTYSVPPPRFGFKRALLLAAYRKARHIFFISAYTQKRVCERLPFVPPRSIVHLATTSLPDPNIDATSLKEKYGISRAARVILTVGEVKDRKGQLDTLKAVLKLRETRPELVYVVVGEAPKTGYVDALIGEASTDPGALVIVRDASGDADLSAWYQAADVFVLSSNKEDDHFEGFGLVFLEAAQFGVPGVGTKECGIEDAIEDKVSGVLVPQRDSRLIAAAIEIILADRERFSDGARAFAKKFSWHMTVEAYRAIYYT